MKLKVNLPIFLYKKDKKVTPKPTPAKRGKTPTMDKPEVVEELYYCYDLEMENDVLNLIIDEDDEFIIRVGKIGVILSPAYYNVQGFLVCNGMLTNFVDDEDYVNHFPNDKKKFITKLLEDNGFTVTESLFIDKDM